MIAIRGYDDIKRLAAETDRRIPDLLAMASQNDPFYVMPAQVKQRHEMLLASVASTSRPSWIQ